VSSVAAAGETGTAAGVAMTIIIMIMMVVNKKEDDKTAERLKRRGDNDLGEGYPYL
jgi:hypothetical protein